jgi:hypothetical protein
MWLAHVLKTTWLLGQKEWILGQTPALFLWISSCFCPWPLCLACDPDLPWLPEQLLNLLSCLTDLPPTAPLSPSLSLSWHPIGFMIIAPDKLYGTSGIAVWTLGCFLFYFPNHPKKNIGWTDEYIIKQMSLFLMIPLFEPCVKFQMLLQGLGNLPIWSE